MTDRLPAAVRIAALLLVLYGAAVLANALAAQSAGVADGRGMLRAVVRCAGTGLLAWALLRRERWAWWASVLLSALWLVMGVLAWVALASLNGAGREWWQGRGTVFLAGGVLLLAGALACLLTPSARAALRRPPP